MERSAREGATVVLLPNASASAAFGLKLGEQRFFIGKVAPSPLLAGLMDGDLYMKSWKTMPVACAGGGWEILAEPGLVAVKKIGRGRMIACQLDLKRLGEGRSRIKALRFWNILLANLGAERLGFKQFLSSGLKVYELNDWEQIPPYINW